MKKLEELIDDFSTLRETFHNYTSRGEVKKESLNELQEKFVKIKSELTYWKSKMIKSWTRTDDKAATAIKYRIAVAISRGEFTDKDAEEPMPKCTLSVAEKLAAGSQTYKEFIDKRAFNKESMTNISDLREDCNSYINLIKDLIK
jgi:hypothetical protein